MTSTPKAMLELAERAESAPADEQYQLLTDAFVLVHGPLQTNPRPGIVAHNPRWFGFKKMLDALAYESAAMTLVPEGGSFEVGSRGERGKPYARCIFAHPDPTKLGIRTGRGATPAQALTAACLRSLANGGNHG